MNNLYSKIEYKKIPIKEYIKLPIYLYQRYTNECHLNNLINNYKNNIKNGNFYFINDPIIINCDEKLLDKENNKTNIVLIDSQHRANAIKMIINDNKFAKYKNKILNTEIFIKIIYCETENIVNRLFIELNNVRPFNVTDFGYITNKNPKLNLNENFNNILKKLVTNLDKKTFSVGTITKQIKQALQKLRCIPA